VNLTEPCDRLLFHCVTPGCNNWWMHAPHLLQALLVALLIAGLTALARRVHVISPILLLVVGALIAFTPGIPQLVFDPDLVLLTLLPPLLYSSGVDMSWRGFCTNLRPILLLAVGCVLFTATAVAALGHFLLGMPWAVGFVLGAVVAPPDAVAPMAVMKHMRLPRRLITILEGESLVNDATALVIFGFALATVFTGTFSLSAAVGQFLAIVLGEIVYGIMVGWLMLRVRHLAADPLAEVLLALATPFLAFWPPHAVGSSGVVACVATGLYVSWNGQRLIRPATRLQGYFIWGLVTWSIEALVFLLTGLQARVVVSAISGEGWNRALLAGALVSLTVILVRFVWVFPATYLPRWLIPAVGRADPSPNWRFPFLVSFSGPRGVVTLAAALSIPFNLDGQAFPDRDIILFTAFSVIAVTLVVLAAALPIVATLLGLASAGQQEAVADKRDERRVRLEGIDAVLRTLDTLPQGSQPFARETIRRWHSDRRAQLIVTADESNKDDPVAEASRLQLDLIEVERASIARAYADNCLTDEARRRIERELDLDEARIRHALASTSLKGGDPAD
jgi:monovalent cation/hydrogen antiporter